MQLLHGLGAEEEQPLVTVVFGTGEESVRLPVAVQRGESLRKMLFGAP
jgi:hypothetical protein